MMHMHPPAGVLHNSRTSPLNESPAQVVSFEAPKVLLSEHPLDWHDLARLGDLDHVRFLAVEDYPLHIIQVHKVRYFEPPIAPTFSARAFIAWTGTLINDTWWYQDLTGHIELRNDVCWPQRRSLQKHGRVIQQTLAYILENGHSLCLLDQEPTVANFIRRDFNNIGRQFD